VRNCNGLSYPQADVAAGGGFATNLSAVRGKLAQPKASQEVYHEGHVEVAPQRRPTRHVFAAAIGADQDDGAEQVPHVPFR
jgi:hypothetical protein